MASSRGSGRPAISDVRSFVEAPVYLPNIIAVGSEAFGRFLATIFDEWSRNDVGDVYVQHFDTALANWYGEPGAVCVFSETCGAAVALEHDGDVYSCGHFVEPDYLLGNITETPLGDLVRSQTPAAVRTRQSRPTSWPWAITPSSTSSS